MKRSRRDAELTGFCSICGVHMSMPNGGRLRVACEGACTKEHKTRLRQLRYFRDTRCALPPDPFKTPIFVGTLADYEGTSW